MAKEIIGIIDDGTIEVPLKNKLGMEICSIRFRPADASIIDRYNELMDGFDTIVEPLKNVSLKADGSAEFEDGWAALKQTEALLIEKINAVFDTPDAGRIFEKRNAFSSIGGVFFCEHVLNALGKIIEDALKEEGQKSEKRMKKYLADLPSLPGAPAAKA